MSAKPNQAILQEVTEKIKRSQRLDFEDALALFQCPDILHLGALADRITQTKQGSNVYYSVNRHIHYTNLCRMNCRFCRFSRRPDEPGQYTKTVEELLNQTRRAAQQSVTEIHIVGGINPDLPADYYFELIRRIHQLFPAIHIKAFTAVEIIDLAHKSGYTVEETLLHLQQLGLGSMPGGGAEILSDDYFRQVCPHKPLPAEWLTVHRTAHQLGIYTNATMLFGYIESRQDRINHLLTLRRQQDDSLAKGRGRFQCFVPLSYQEHKSSQPASNLACPNSALEELKTIAISRLLLDNFDHVKAFWPMLGLALAQIALRFGADDLDGTVGHYDIVNQHLDNPPQTLTTTEIRRLITETGKTPLQRDGFYCPLASD